MIHIVRLLRTAIIKILSVAHLFGESRAYSHFALSRDGGEPFVSLQDATEEVSLLPVDQRQKRISNDTEAGLRRIVPEPEINSVSDDPPGFTDGPPQVVHAKDSKSTKCFAVLINDQMLEAQNDIIAADTDLQFKKETLRRVEARLLKIKSSVEDAINLVADAEPGGDEEASSRLDQLQTKLAEHCEKKKVIKRQIAALEDSITTDRKQIWSLVEEAMKEAGLLNEPVNRATDNMSEDSNEQVETENRLHTEAPAKLEISEEEQAIIDAKQNFHEAEVAKQKAQLTFNCRNLRYQKELAGFEAALAAGECDMTRSEFDCRNLALDQQLTRALIDAEAAFWYAKGQAEELGCFDDGLGQESHYGESHCSEPSVTSADEPEDGWRPHMGRATLASVESWIDRVDAPYSPGAVVMVHDDDNWKAEPVEAWDSQSCVDYDFYVREIACWQCYVNQNREDWQPPGPEAEEDEGGEPGVEEPETVD